MAHQPSELVKRRDLDSAGARKLFLDRGHSVVGENIPVWANDAFAVGASGFLGVDINPKRFGTPLMGVFVFVRWVPNTASRFDAGSVLTMSTRLPAWASISAVAQAAEVFPTPPLPVKKRKRVGS